MRTTFALRNRKQTTSPINGFVHSNGWQVILATGLKIESKLWDQRRKRARKGSSNELAINTALAKIETDVATVFEAMRTNGEEPTPERFKKRYRSLRAKPPTERGAKRKGKPKTLYDRYDEFIEESKSRVKHASLQIHHTVISHLKKFEEAYSVRVVYERVDLLLFDKLFAYLTNVAQVNNVTAWKLLKTFKTFLRWSFDRGYTTSTEYKKFTSRRIPKGQKSTKVYLTPEELEKIVGLDLADNPRLDRVRDLYVFQAFTGMRFGDVRAFRFEHITGDEIEFVTGKNRKAVRVPILPEARRILEKYNYHLPQISTQKQNDYLREVTKRAEIDTPVVTVDFRGTKRIEKTVPKWKLITTHSAKRCFVTNLRRYGVSVESLMRITGNCRATIERYIVTTTDDALDEVRKAMAR